MHMEIPTLTKKKSPRGLRNNNPLNIRKGNNWVGERSQQSDQLFEEFESLEYGFRAAFIIIKNYMRSDRGSTTPRSIVSRWAPPSENDTESYLDYVCRRAVLLPDERLKWSTFGADKNKICMLVWAMAQYECGMEFSFGRVENAFAMACR